MKKTAVIIVTYNAMKWTDRCFTSLRKSSEPVHCIVVDNGSTDGTQEYIRNHFPEVEFIQSTENLGFGKANNLGIERAYKNGADFFYLLNQDAWVYEDTIAKIIRFYEEHPTKDQIGIISPIHLDGTEKNVEIFVEKYLAQNALQERIFTDLLIQKNKIAYDIDFVNAAHWFLPKETIEKVGGFNSYFFHYGEDNEYVNRIKFHQKKIFLLKDCYAVHDGKQIIGKVDYTKYIDTTIDTKILNPNLGDVFSFEIKSLQKSMLKCFFQRDFANYKHLKSMLQRIKSSEKTLRENKQYLMTQPHAFLNL